MAPPTAQADDPAAAAGLAGLARRVLETTRVDIRQYRPQVLAQVLAQRAPGHPMAGHAVPPSPADAWALTAALEAQAWAGGAPPPCPAQLQQALQSRQPGADTTRPSPVTEVAGSTAVPTSETEPWLVWLPACPDARVAALWRQRLQPVLGAGAWLVTRTEGWHGDEPAADGVAHRRHNALRDPPPRCRLVIGHGLLWGVATHVQRRLLRQLAGALGPHGLLWLPVEAEAAARTLGWLPASAAERGPSWWQPPPRGRALGSGTVGPAAAGAPSAKRPAAAPAPALTQAPAAAASPDLARAMRRRELLLHYQPQFDLATGRATGVEALLRWRHPAHGLLGPSTLVQAAEASGGIHALGRWVLQEACQQLACWRAGGHPVDRIAVNVSTLQWLRPQFVDEVLSALAAAGLAPERLVLELTESRPWPATPGPGRALARCREAGIGLSLDDFGSGHAGPEALQRLPLTQLKIDRGLLDRVPVDPRAEARLRRGIALAGARRLEVVVEGVQQTAQLAWLRGLGAHAYQGHLGAPALDAGAAARYFN